MDSISDRKYVEVPQWKKDLIARLKNGGHKGTSTASTIEHCNHSYQSEDTLQLSLNSEANATSKSASDAVVTSHVLLAAPWDITSSKFINTSNVVSEHYPDNCKLSLILKDERYHHHQLCENGGDSDSDDFHYGPGIVKKLKNKYLSLALRESNSRHSILHLRKATSLENVLEDDIYTGNKKIQSHVSHRKNTALDYYRNGQRPELKRARSVEIISRLEDAPIVGSNNLNRQSFHEDLLIALDTQTDIFIKKPQDGGPVEHINQESNCNNLYYNRPKKTQAVVDDKEKPPPEFVKQAKMIFERRPEHRTRPPVHTGDVAAKVHNFNNIIVKSKVEAKVSKKLMNKHKPINNDKMRSFAQPIIPTLLERDPNMYGKKNDWGIMKKKLNKESLLPSPFPDISMIDFQNKGQNDSENRSLSETPDLILTSSPLSNASLIKARNILGHSVGKEEIRSTNSILDNVTKKSISPVGSPTSVKPASPLLMSSQNRPLSPLRNPTKLENVDGLIVTDKTNLFKELKAYQISENNINSTDVATRESNNHISQCLNVISEFDDSSEYNARLPPKFSPPPPPETEPALFRTGIFKNSVRNLNSTRAEVVNKNVLVRKTVTRDESATTVFNFTNRKDVPDYISNDQSRTPSRPKLPKSGEGGVILLSSSNLEFLVDEDEALIRSLECPPSPCDVTFINDNILIDGKSSFNKKNKEPKMKISFIDDADVYEYPSETSLMLEESLSSSQLHSSNSTLANYIPKSTEDFEPGVTRSLRMIQPKKPDVTVVEQTPVLTETDVSFSSGTNPDILF